MGSSSALVTDPKGNLLGTNADSTRAKNEPCETCPESPVPGTACASAHDVASAPLSTRLLPHSDVGGKKPVTPPDAEFGKNEAYISIVCVST